MLGGRGRSSFRRTTSMIAMSIDVPNNEASADSIDVPNNEASPPSPPTEFQNPMTMEPDGYDRSVAMLSRKNSRKSYEDSQIETAHFLKRCGLCRRRLAPACDIYMYRGDLAFCSEECREQQIKQNEVKKSRSASVANNISGGSHRSEVVVAAAETSGKNEPVVAA